MVVAERFEMEAAQTPWFDVGEAEICEVMWKWERMEGEGRRKEKEGGRGRESASSLNKTS